MRVTGRRRLLALALAAAAALGAVGCGESGDGKVDEAVVQQRIDDARADAAREARLEERVRQLERELRARRARRAAPAVTRTVTTAAPPPSTPAASGGGWIAQLGSFQYRDNADRRLAELRGDGVAASILRSDDYAEMQPGYWVVFAGFYDSEGAAQSAAAQGRGAGVSDAFVRHVTADG